MDLHRMDTDQRWERDFVLALRTREITGKAIGGALAEVKAHCAESGETPREAFGEPLVYAQQLDFASPDRVSDPGYLAPVVLYVAGVWLFPPAAGAVLRGADMALTWGQIISTVAALGLLTLTGRVVRGLVGRAGSARLMLFTVAFMVAAVLPAMLIRAEAARINGVLPALVGAVLLLVGVVAQVRLLRQAPCDEVVDPLAPRAPRDQSRFRSFLIVTGPVLAVVVALALTWVDWKYGGSAR